MLLGELMNARGIPNPDYAGILTNDDNVLAINISGDPDAHPDTYAVVQGAIVGVNAQLNPVTQDKQYIREGLSTTKTGTQRTFTATGDRYIGDEFQDYVFDFDRLYGVGEAVVTDYVWFCILNGKGEKGKISIVDNSDGSGNAGETAAVDIALRKAGAMPSVYEYAKSGPGSLGTITVTSVAGTASGDTKVTATPALPGGHTASYKTAATVTLPAYDATVTGWTSFTSGTDYTATTGNEIGVVYLDGSGKVKYAGKATVTAKA